MFLLYLDASGTPEQQDPNTKHYVFLGVAMPEQDWSALDGELRSLKHRYGYPGLDFELHVKQFAVTIKEQEKIADFATLSREDRRTAVLKRRAAALGAEPDPDRRGELNKRFRATDPFVHLTRAERSQLLEDAVDLIAGADGLRLFADAVSKEHPAVKERRADPVREVFGQVIPRFDTFLDKIAKKAQALNPRGRIDHGLLILDRDAATEATFSELFRRFRDHGHPLGDLRHVIDVPFFADSEKVSGLQLADVCAYVVRRYLDTGARPGSHEERQFRTIFHLFDRDPRGRLHGLRHYVPAGVCPCLICAERGHGMPDAARVPPH